MKLSMLLYSVIHLALNEGTKKSVLVVNQTMSTYFQNIGKMIIPVNAIKVPCQAVN